LTLPEDTLIVHRNGPTRGVVLLCTSGGSMMKRRLVMAHAIAALTAVLDKLVTIVPQAAIDAINAVISRLGG
jgi:hypothetical protein